MKYYRQHYILDQCFSCPHSVGQGGYVRVPKEFKKRPDAFCRKKASTDEEHDNGYRLGKPIFGLWNGGIPDWCPLDNYDEQDKLTIDESL